MSAASTSNKPLAKRTILVACSAKKMVELVSGIEKMGGTALPLPIIEAREIKDTSVLDQSLELLGSYAWIIFTSVHGVEFFMRRLKEREGSTGPQSMPKICAIGPATARAVHEFGYTVALIPDTYVAEGVAEALRVASAGFGTLAGQRVLLPRAKEAREVLPEALTAAGAIVDIVPCYQTVRADIAEDMVRRIRAAKPDLMVFTSSSAVRNVVDMFGPEDGKMMLLESIVAVIGPVTGSTAQSFGKCAEIVPEENTIASLLEAIRVYFGGGRS